MSKTVILLNGNAIVSTVDHKTSSTKYCYTPKTSVSGAI